ncbi:MAG: FkbM family methyltransferase [Myxococcales bacterium]|nr:FkbM family methyltransferase [Myxococcales bacterium]
MGQATRRCPALACRVGMNGPMWMYRRLPRITHLWRRLARANYEREMELLPALCDRDKTGIDIGAKVGMYTYRIRANSSDVVVFEPIPLFHEMLRAVFEGKRGHIEPVAVSSEAGRVKMRLPYSASGDWEYGRATIEPKNALTNEVVARVEELEVEVRPLDAYGWESVGFIKVDVEGHELAVLAGGEQTIARHRPNLLVECNDEHNPGAPAKLAAWLSDRGYEVLFFDRQRLRPFAEYDRDVHWGRHTIENFIGLHTSRPEQRARLEARVAQVARPTAS